MPAKRIIRDESGVAAIEFALVMPVFMALILGIWFMGVASHTTNDVRHALAMGARALQINPDMTQGQLQTLVQGNVFDALDSGTVTVALAFGDNDNNNSDNDDPDADGDSDVNNDGVQLAIATATYPIAFRLPFVGTYAFNYTITTTVPITDIMS